MGPAVGSATPKKYCQSVGTRANRDEQIEQIGKSPFILWIEGFLLMMRGVYVLDVPWQQEEYKWRK